MQKRYLATLLVALGWAVFAPAPWAGLAQAQTTLLNTTVAVTSYTAPNPRGAIPNTNLTLNLVAGNVYDIRTAVATSPAYAIDSYIYLLDPTGAYVTEDDDNGLGLGNPYGSQITYTAASSGAYTLVVTTYGGASYPSVPVVVTYTAPPPPPPPPSSTIIPLPYPANDSRAITAPNTYNQRGTTYNANVFSITLTAGTPVQMFLDYTGSATTWPNDDNYMYLYGPNSWTYITENDDGDAGMQHDGVYTGFGGSFISYTPTTTGTYYIVATTYASGVTMSSSQLSVGPPGVRPAPGAPVGSGSNIPNVKWSPPGKLGLPGTLFALNERHQPLAPTDRFVIAPQDRLVVRAPKNRDG